MGRARLSMLGVALGVGVSACAAPPASSPGGGTAAAILDGRTYQVSNVTLTVSADPAYFRIEGDDAANPGEDCLPGLDGGLALYGDLPDGVTTVTDLAGHELPFEFSGDGDDFNLCFVGSNGLLGVERGTIRFDAAQGETVTFSFTGEFVRYDGEGGTAPGRIKASGSGTALVSRN